MCIRDSSEEDCRKLRRFAIELGLAFQLQDDLLDSYGDDRLGKAIGGDILEGKQTYLMITAMSRADEATREALRTTRLLSLIHICYYFGGGHSEDNIAVWIPSAKLLFAGCMVKEMAAQNAGNQMCIRDRPQARRCALWPTAVTT